MKILIDADSCPVVDIALSTARDKNIACVILCDSSHVFEKEDAVTVTVTKGADSVDFTLVNMISAGDIVITQDYGLAAMCLARRAVCISQNGFLYSDSNIDSLLQARYAARKIRRSGGRLKGPQKRTPDLDRRFRDLLEKVLISAEQ